jgi:hypothetical protein
MHIWQLGSSNSSSDAIGHMSVVFETRFPTPHPTHQPRTKVYDWDSNQKEIFEITARPIIDAVMDGYNGAALQGSP